MKKLLIVLFCFVQTICAGVQISENTASRLSFTWIMDGLSILDSAGKPASVTFKNQNVELGDSGQPIIPAFSFLVGVPPKGKAVIQVTAISIRIYSLKNSLMPRKTRTRIIRYSGLRFTDTWVSDARPCTFGQLHADQFILKPFIYDEKNRTLQVLEKAQCTIGFPAFQQNGKAQAVGNSDYQKMLSRLILNFDVAGKWAIRAPGMPKRKFTGEFPLAPTKPMITFKIGDGHDSINEGTINENGIIKISGNDLLQLLGSPLQMNQLACFCSNKGELPVPTPDIASLPDGVSEVPLMRFDRNQNGTVDPDDYVLLYGTGASDWAFDTVSQQYCYNLDRFEDFRHYWLFVKQAGAPLALQRMPTVSGPVTATVTSFQNHILFKKPINLSSKGGDQTKGEEGGLDWYWQKLSINSPGFEYQATLPLIDTSNPVAMKIVPGVYDGGIQLNVSFSKVPVCSTCQPSEWNAFNYNGDRTVRINTSNISGTSSFELAQLEFKYTTRLDMSNATSMTVFSPESAGVVRYVLGPLPRQLVYIFRITPAEAVQLVDTVQGQDVSSFSWTDSAGKGIKYYICLQTGFRQTPAFSLQPAAQSSGVYAHDLRAANNPASNRADFMVISHPDFLTQAVRLANHKQGIGRFSAAKVIDIMDIYREFSGGAVDPAALRNFLVYARSQWGVCPEYVVLLGKGHYNYKGIKTSEPVYLPVAEFPNQCTEDYFAYLDAGEDPVSSSSTPDIFIGRLPCTTVPQATQMVDKIVDFEDPASADFAAWRDRVVLVNDDDMQGTSDDPLHDQHLRSSEFVGSLIVSHRPSVDLRKINLFEYPWNEVQQKPEARSALLNEINNGAAFVNYFGHGSNSLWADERVLDQDALANLHNDKRYPLISSFSCSVGHFDRPDIRSLSEAMVLAVSSGAIATISATREAFADANEDLANAFYGEMFDSTRSGTTFGQAYAAAKVTIHDANAQSYSLLGDPSIRPDNCVRSVALDIFDKTGASIDTLKALQTITIRGSIRINNGSTIDANYGSASRPASIQLSMFNPSYTTSRKDNGADQTITYSMPGTPVFTGQTDVKNGTFEQAVHLPRKVTFNKAGASVIAFAWQGPDNGLGQKNIVFSGSDTGSADTVGPTIAIRQLFDQTGSASVNKATVNALTTGGIKAVLPFSCEIDVFDPSGIDVVGTGPDEGLTIEIPGVLSKQNINQKFRFGEGDYKKGAAAMEFTDGMVRSGSYTMTISAQDLAGNVTRKDFVLEVSQGQDLAISQVFNYPNPMKMGGTTAFYFNVSKTSGITCTIKLYTLSGKLIRVFYGAHSGEIFDGRDQMGNLLGPRVYLYQVIAEDNSQAQQTIVKSGIQKLAVHPPR
jgi:Peptidase family C25.